MSISETREGLGRLLFGAEVDESKSPMGAIELARDTNTLDLACASPEANIDLKN